MKNKRRSTRRAGSARATSFGHMSAQTPMSPGEAPPPVPGMVPPDGEPRQFSFPIGYNITTRPRSYEADAFETLRGFATLYSGVQICERVYLDIIGRLEPQIVRRDDGQPAARDQADRVRDLLASPDGTHDLREWLSAATRDLLEIDAVTVYRRRRRDGRLFGLDLVDGATIKPLLDITGRRPEPPEPAYQQFVWGMPAGKYSTREMDYLFESPRVDSPYGFSRVERILFTLNHALRKQHYDLARFTDGVVPAGMLSPPPEFPWTPEQVTEYEHGFNALLAGNDQLRARVKVLPPGFTFAMMNPEPPSTDFDQWLLNVTAACFGLTMAELGMTEQFILICARKFFGA